MKGRAFSLIEVVVGLGLLALILPLALNLVPSGLFAQRRAQQNEAAIALARGWLEQARSTTQSAGLYGPQMISVGQYNYRVSQEVYNVDAYLQDVVVVVQTTRGLPVRLATRIVRK